VDGRPPRRRGAPIARIAFLLYCEDHGLDAVGVSENVLLSSFNNGEFIEKAKTKTTNLKLLKVHIFQSQSDLEK